MSNADGFRLARGKVNAYGRRDLNEQVRGADHDPRDDSEYARAQQKVGDDGHWYAPHT